MPAVPAVPERLSAIEAARRALMDGPRQALADATALPPWIARSWQRCLARGQRPTDRVGFDVVGRAILRGSAERSHALRTAAGPVLADLDRVIAPTRYFSILTDADGVVVAVGATADQDLPAVRSIARLGVDLSERSVGTTAIGAALGELHPVWLHRGEHFFDATAVYSCAGAPIVGPDGRCTGMLDLTGVMVDERPALRHLAAQMAARVEDGLLRLVPHRLLLQLRWPGAAPAGDTGLLAVDDDGRVVGTDRGARAMLGLPAMPDGTTTLEQCFATPPSRLLGLTADTPAVTVPLWSGLQVLVGAVAQRDQAPARWRDAEAQLIRDAMAAAHGNVANAARRLGISRATLYRRLGALKLR